MLRHKTVFVIGAGASKEVNLPTGAELAQEVASLMHTSEDEVGRWTFTDRKFNHDVRDFARETLPIFFAAANQIRKGIVAADSIDRYIDRFKENETIRDLGKASILRIISERERNSLLWIDEQRGETEIPSGKIDETWYWVFAKLLFDDIPRAKADTAFDDLQIVCFNYDRCIEHFLIYELVRTFAITPSEAADIVSEKLKIWHPYGWLGNLRVQNLPGSIAFGEDIGGRYFELSHRIKTFGEELDQTQEVDAIRNAIASTPAVVFLGYGFNGQNNRLIEYADGRGRKQHRHAVLATAFNEPENGRQQIASRAQELCGHNTAALVHNHMCVDLLREYRRLLSQ